MKSDMSAETLGLPRLDCKPWSYKTTEIEIGWESTTYDKDGRVTCCGLYFQRSFVARISSYI